MTVSTLTLARLEHILANAPDRRVLWTQWELAARDEYDRRLA